ncbi:MAG: hypothetical protein GY811_14310 [Myxococcales bacterium]|nr:hypothetical protein [Myxococcales bacterium]
MGSLGRGLALYTFVEDIEATLARATSSDVSIVEEIAANPNAGFREFTFKESNGYHVTVAEHPQW